MKKTRRERKMCREYKELGYAKGYLDGYEKGLQDGNPFIVLAKAIKEAIKNLPTIINTEDDIKALTEKTTGNVIDTYAREFFHGVCPYTNIACDKWNCGECEVEQEEREYMESDY